MTAHLHPARDRTLAALPAHTLPGGLVLLNAVTARARARGLGGLAALPAGVALRLRPCRSVHTLGMRFPLDLVWLDGGGSVMRVDAAVAPGRLRCCRRARAVVEARAGEGTIFAAALTAGRPVASSA